MKKNDPNAEMARHFLMAFGAIWLVIVALAVALPAPAQSLDAKPRPVTPASVEAPLDGLYVDQSSPARYCVIETGQFGWFGRQALVHCAAGYNNAGHNFAAPGVQVGREYLLYRLQADAGLMAPAVVNSVTVAAASTEAITVRFGTPGAQSPPYVLTRQPRQPEPLPVIYLAAPFDWQG